MSNNTIYLRVDWNDLEVRYNIEEDCLEARAVMTEYFTVPCIGRPEGHTMSRRYGRGPWVAMPELSEELLQEGRESAAKYR